MRKNKKISIIFLLLIICCIFVGCEEQSDIDLLKSKNLSELEYLENTALSIIKKYIMGDYITDTDQMNWNEINNEFLNFSRSSNTILVDLASLEIDGNKILELENRINEVTNSIKAQDENLFIASMSNLYNLIPAYLEEYSDDTNLIKVKNIKSNFLKCLYYSQIDDFANAKVCIDLIDKEFTELNKNENYIKDNYYRINKNYLIIQEMKNLIELQDKNNIRIKYLQSLESF